MKDARQSGKQYAAFISYGHEGNEEIAAAVENGLKRLAKPWNRLRALEVFRDRSSLAAGPALDAGLFDVLDRSAWLIYLASPSSAASGWVGQELRHWLKIRGPERILIVLTAGEFGWDPARGRLVGDAVHPEFATAFTSQPLHVDLRWARDPGSMALTDPHFRAEILNLAAPLHGVPKEDLEGDDTRERKRTRRLARGAIVTLAALTVAATTASILAVVNLREANRQQATADNRARVATSLRLAQLSRTSRGADGSLGFLLAARGHQFAPTPAAQGALIQLTQADKTYRDEGLARDLTSRIVGHTGGVSAVAIAPDGSRTASLDEAQVVRWVEASAGPATSVPIADARDIAFADRDTLAVATGAGLVWLDLRDGRPAGRVDAARCADLASLGDGRVLCLAPDGEVGLVERTGVRLTRPGSVGVGRAIESSADGRTAAVQGWRGIEVLDLPTLKARAKWGANEEELAGVSPDGSSVALLAAQVSGSAVPSVRIADATTGRTRWTVETEGNVLLPVAAGFLAGGAQVLVASEGLEGQPASFLDGLPEGGASQLRHPPPAPSTVALMAVSQDGRSVAAASRTGEVQTAALPTKTRGLDPVRPLSAAALGHTVLVRTKTGVGVADVRTGSITEVAPTSGGVLSPDGASVLGDDGKLWDVATRKARVEGIPVPADDAVPAFSGDGRRMFYGTGDGRLVMLDLGTGRSSAVQSPIPMYWKYEDRSVFVASLATTHDGSRLAVRTVEPDRAGKSGAVATLKVAEGELAPLTTVRRSEPPSGVWADRPPLGFSPDGRVIVYSGGVAELLDPETLRSTGTKLRGSADGHWSADPNGTTFVASSCAAAIVDTTTFQTLTPMPGPEMLEDVCADVMEAAWTDRGRTLILRNEDFYETYALDGAALVERACGLAGRDLTPDEWQQFIPEWPYERTCAGAAEEPPPAASSAPAVAGPPAAADGDKSEQILEVQRVAGVRLPECAGRAVPATCWYVSQRFLDEAVITRMSAGEPVAYYRVARTGQWVVRDQAKAGPAVIPPAWAR